MEQAITTAIYNGSFKRIQWKATGYRASNSPDSPALVYLPVEQQILAQEHILTLNPGENFINFRHIYKKRASSYTSNLVNVLSAQLLNEKYIQKVLCQIIRVRTERIPWRLSYCQNLTIEQGLSLLYGACNGFSELLLHFRQPFKVSHEMIGMNIYGTIKIWLNPNFARNNLISERQMLPSIDVMKTNIIQLIQEKLQSKSFPMRKQLLNCPNFSWLIVKIQGLLQNFKQNMKSINKGIMKKTKNKNQKNTKLSKPEKISLANCMSTKSFNKNSDISVKGVDLFKQSQLIKEQLPKNPQENAKLPSIQNNPARNNFSIQKPQQTNLLSRLEESYYDLSPTRIHNKNQNSRIKAKMEAAINLTKPYKKLQKMIEENKKIIQNNQSSSNKHRQSNNQSSNGLSFRQKSFPMKFQSLQNITQTKKKVDSQMNLNSSQSMFFPTLKIEKNIQNKYPQANSQNAYHLVSPRLSQNPKMQKKQNIRFSINFQ